MLDRNLVIGLSRKKEESEWMLQERLKALQIFEEKKMPEWGGDLSGLNLEEINYYIEPVVKEKKSWGEVPEKIKETFERIGVPKAELEVLAGVKGQWDSEVIYGSLKKELFELGVVFVSMDEGLQRYPEIVKKYMGTVVPMEDNKLSALNTAVWSGGSFLYVPKGIKVKRPLQAYFWIESERMGQFERTLIVAEEGSEVTYIEGCSAPVYSSASLHAGVVEVVVKKKAKVNYVTVQNWYKNIYNLVTKRAWVGEEAEMRWVDGNLGSRVTMKYPACVLAERGAKGEMLSIAWSGEGQYQDVGAKMIHLAPETRSQIINKSISKDGGKNSYRGLVRINKGAVGSRARVVCDALILDQKSKSSTYPVNKVSEGTAVVEHEAKVGRMDEERVVYLMSRGMKRSEAEMMIVNGFLEPVMKTIPMEYAMEMNRLIGFEMEGAVG